MAALLVVLFRRLPSYAAFLLDAIGVDDRARVVVTHDTGNYLGCIESIWAALSIDEGGEGICAAPFGDMTLRLSLPIVVVLT